MIVVTGFIRSAEGREALKRSIEEVRQRGGRLIVVHSSEGGTSESAVDVLADNEELERIHAELSAEGIDHEVMDFARGSTPAEDVVSVANESKADLIVIGLRRRSLVGKLLLGSNAQDILMQADCPVLGVKPAIA
jgi:nucleotide-binding universal stress UspA family protein